MEIIDKLTKFSVGAVAVVGSTVKVAASPVIDAFSNKVNICFDYIGDAADICLDSASVTISTIRGHLFSERIKDTACNCVEVINVYIQNSDFVLNIPEPAIICSNGSFISNTVFNSMGVSLPEAITNTGGNSPIIMVGLFTLQGSPIIAANIKALKERLNNKHLTAFKASAQALLAPESQPSVPEVFFDKLGTTYSIIHYAA